MSIEKQLQRITTRYFGDFDHPGMINMGWCYVWAWMVRLHLGERAQLCSVWGAPFYGRGVRAHAFVAIDRLYYDAECLVGAGRFASLQACRVGKPRTFERMSPDTFLLRWDGERQRGNFVAQGLLPWPVRIPARRPRPPVITPALDERFGWSSSA